MLRHAIPALHHSTLQLPCLKSVASQSEQLTHRHNLISRHIFVHPRRFSLSLSSPSATTIVSTNSLTSPESESDVVRAGFCSLAEAKVDDWTSECYADVPFEPDPNIFEPINVDYTYGSRPGEKLCEAIIRPITSEKILCDRVVTLLDTDFKAADQLRREIVKNRVTLPSSEAITSHCNKHLFERRDVRSYLDWLPLVAATQLQRQISTQPQYTITVAESHLREVLWQCPTDLDVIFNLVSTFLDKQSFTKHLAFSLIRHLVRSQAPEAVLHFMEQVFPLIGQTNPRSKSLSHQIQDFLLIQLALRGHLHESIKLLEQSRNREEEGSVYSLCYQVLVDQITRRIKKEGTGNSGHWYEQLEKVFSLWRYSDESGFHRWKSNYLEPQLQLGTSSLTRKISKRNSLERSQQNIKFTESITSVRTFFRKLLSTGGDVRFVKAARVAAELDQLLPLPPQLSDLILTENGNIYQDEEQVFKSVILSDHLLVASEGNLTAKVEVSLKSSYLKVEGRSDVLLLWAHTWMILYQRRGSHQRAIETFLRYFVPMGFDQTLLHRIQEYSGNRLSLVVEGSDVEKHPKNLLHPTSGVISVLYDAILGLCPPRMIPIAFEYFLSHPMLQPTKPRGSIRSSNESPQIYPEFTFKPFVRAFLKINDVTSSLKVLMVMNSQCNSGLRDDEMAWVDLLEWCAASSLKIPANSVSGNIPGGWTSLRRQKKIKGWDVKMKEQLVYSILKKFLIPFTTSPITVKSCSFLEKEDHVINPLSFFPQSANEAAELAVEEKLRDIGWNKANDVQLNSNQRFPSLKLLYRVKSGFQRVNNLRATIIISSLIDWKRGK
ncbi:hypothetical protein BY996DRAFT_4596361 [Phakopsora pachyrhizi]|nr:hypothetical protein BY996DRAFT_4596361 [Phakopsora pachyrhizi]